MCYNSTGILFWQVREGIDLEHHHRRALYFGVLENRQLLATAQLD